MKGIGELGMAALVGLAVLLRPAAEADSAAARKADPRVKECRAALDAKAGEGATRKVLSSLRTPKAEEELDGLAQALAGSRNAAAAIRELVSHTDPAGPGAAAELLWRVAQRGGLTEELAGVAADLLAHEDPFVRALAEWAIAVRVGLDNGGQEIVWPRPEAPEWFRRWLALSPEFHLEADYVRMAATCGIHHDGARLSDSVRAIARRAQAAAEEIRRSAPPSATLSIVEQQLAELASIQARIARRVEEAPRDLPAHRRLWLAARRAARPIVMANPAVDFERIVFVLQHAAHSHPNITGSQYPWIHKPAGDICVKAGLEPGAKVRGVIAGQLGPGHVHGIDLWWDADRVVFGFARQPKWPPQWDAVRGDDSFHLRLDQEPTHLFEITLDGSGLRQLTRHRVWTDFEPTYCADGEVVFASDRSGRSSECGKFSADHTVVNLYAVSPDGRGLRRLSDNKDIDRYPHSLDNGMIGYTRWEYQERHFFEVHALWQVRPDGTMSDAVSNQHLKAPYGLRDTRSIPTSAKLVAVATGHHTFAYGPVVTIDPRQGINDPAAIAIVTPGSAPEEGPMGGRPVAEGGVPDRGGLYQTPWALSETCFLVSYSHARPAGDRVGGRNPSGFSLYLIDVYGNKELVHRDPILSAVAPMPLKKRRRPPILPRMTDPAAGCATCYLADVHEGLEGVRRGEVKYVRISQRVGWPLDERAGAMRYIPGNAWEKHFGFWEWAPVRVIGTVKVEDDGSAHFRVPVDTSLYFQALDAQQMELRRMRSHVTFQPGEVRGCTGCHESRLRTPQQQWRPRLALNREPETPTPPPWGPRRLLGYEWLVQPVFDRHCVRCHNATQAEGGIDLAATRGADGLMQSFGTLFGRGSDGKARGPVLVACSDRFSDAAITRPKEFGSHRSRLVRVLLDDPLHQKEARLNPAEWTALVTWVDANAPYYDAFFNKRPAGAGPPRREIHIELAAPFANAAPPAASAP